MKKTSVKIYLSPVEREILEKKAIKYSIDISGLIRLLVFNAEIENLSIDDIQKRKRNSASDIRKDLYIRMSEAEKSSIRKKAKSLKMKDSEFLRFVSLNFELEFVLK